ncbi:hypothetical protein ASD97_40020 [Streptomyces sp. Root63]|uniref:hypothetical protein n=1 Tax=unclassified Streptomyces TaxID=2593676 RepID=UPI000700B601|nr:MULTISPECIES: hypothetical protein [unclassified Streptomyces]KQX44504.1 hypothetical protein ASD29_00345 [Streptomyces sp. Root1295]KRA42717.1 hypothetical protein ASD97_40020 [Streptomyces sp. Root63]
MTSRAPATELSRDEARHIAIAAALPADGFPTVTAALAHLHIVQLDGISALARPPTHPDRTRTGIDHHHG